MCCEKDSWRATGAIYNAPRTITQLTREGREHRERQLCFHGGLAFPAPCCLPGGFKCHTKVSGCLIRGVTDSLIKVQLPQILQQWAGGWKVGEAILAGP